MRNQNGFDSDENKRERALRVIDLAKSKHRTNTRAVTAALEKLAILEHKAYIPDFARYHGRPQQCATESPTHLQRRHVDTSGAAFTIGGEIVPIQQPFTAEDIDLRNGWTEPGESQENPFAGAADSLSKIVAWLAEGKTCRRIGLRGLALITVLNPAAFQDRCSGSLSSIAKLFGLSRQELQRFTRELRELTADRRWVGHNQRYHGRQKNREAALAYHKRVGHKLRNATA